MTTIESEPSVAERTPIRTIDGRPLVPQQVTIPVDLPRPFETVDQERAHRKAKLAGALRIFGRFGFSEGVAGHITVRDPEYPELFWVNPFGKSFRQMKASDLVLVDHSGNVVYGSSMVNTAAFAIHSAIHEARPDVVAAAHSHSVYGKAFSSLGIPLRPLTQDACAFYDDHTVIAVQGGAVVFDVEAGRELAAAFPNGKAAIHQNHGLFTVGETVDAAAFWFITMERSCQAQLMAMAAGDPIDIRHEYAQYTFEQTGHPLAGYLQFQPLWEDICRSDPELFE